MLASVPKRRYCVTIDNLHANCFNSAFIHISNSVEEVNNSSKSVLNRKMVSQDVVRAKVDRELFLELIESPINPAFLHISTPLKPKGFETSATRKAAMLCDQTTGVRLPSTQMISPKGLTRSLLA